MGEANYTIVQTERTPDVATVGVRTTRASCTVVGVGGVASSRLSFDAHQRNVLTAYPPRRLKASARSPLARHADTRSTQISVVLGSMPPTMRYPEISSLDGARAALTNN